MLRQRVGAQSRQHAFSVLSQRVRSYGNARGRLATPRRPSTAVRSMTQAKEQSSDFDLSVAVALAATAFEAYLEPTGAKGLEDRAVNGTLTTYTDRQFILSTFEGLLTLTVHQAKGLAGVNLVGGSSDPYVMASIGDSSRQTEVLWGTTNPIWDAQLVLYVKSAAEQVLRLRVYDKNNLLSDQDLGSAMVKVAALTQQPGRRLTLPLLGGADQGEIEVSASWQPFAGADSATLEAVLADGLEAPSEETAAVAAAMKDKDVAVSDAAADDSLKLEEVVAAARSKALEALDSSIAGAAQQLTTAGLKGQASKLEGIKAAAAEQVTSAADKLSELVESKGLGKLPVSSMSKILDVLQERAAAGGSSTEEAAAATGSSTDAEGKEEARTVTPEEMQGAWKALARAAGKMVDEIFTPVAYLDNPGTDTQAWVHVSRELREVVVAFRGTEQVKWKDLAADINLVPTALDEERTGGVDLGLGISLPFGNIVKGKDLMVHSGFLSAYDSVRGRVLSLVAALTAGATPSEPWVVWVTGHSLGGALATLAAYELAGRREAKSGAHKIIMYTYGAPRVGNRTFATAFNNRLQGASWRITNSNDIVPTVPRLMGYAHVKTGVRLTSGGVLEFETGSRDLLGEGREVAEVITDLASKALEVVKGSGDAAALLEPLKDQEMAVLSSLVNGSALEQHMEDFYLLTLKDCVLAAAPQLKEQVEEAVAAAVAAQKDKEKEEAVAG